MRISDWSSDVCSSDLDGKAGPRPRTADRISCQGNHGGLAVSGTRPLNGVMTHASFPAIRMRRTRAAAWSRAMFAENRIGPQDLIWPLFVTEGKEVEEPVSSLRSEEHTSELQSLMRISYAVFCLKKKKITHTSNTI